ncbi:TPA: hypothetical protein R8F97_003309 [Pseudomonas putida]|uniref:hypothetical protein n=1 Tax=Pseudomonas putida TaxID=303 RepID=UPI000281DF6B|nr:hypothetical protein [Pseudomonas putida]EMR47090.1 hypothetical protein PPUTLS46_011555 [Pseudomonas putida LS46]HEE9762400.1 hypothetical protein [Pseudomonas putida]
MTFAEQLNAFFTTPTSRTKLVTLRTIWRDRDARQDITRRGEQGVDVEALYDRLKATNPGLLVLVQSLATSTAMHLDAVLMVPMRIPLTRHPITLAH